ncbi:MAG: CHRD domain-containing protein [Ignavibacteria bacterium]
MQNPFIFFKTVLIMFILLSVCNISNATLYDINVPINSSQEVPPNASLGTGTLTGTYNDVTNTLKFKVTFSGLTGNTSAAHFHGPAASGVNAGVRIGLTGFPTGVMSGNYSNTFVLSASDETEMLSGLWYLNIHSSSFGGGEIRGQVNAVAVAALDLISLIEGMYDIGTNLSVRDTLTVNVRQFSSPYSLVESKKVFMRTNGNDTVIFPLAVMGIEYYYIQTDHRNALETWSGGPIMFVGVSGYDFSTNDGQAFGNNQVLKGVRYCFYSGDVNKDGLVDIGDLSQIDNDANNFVGGYVTSDLNGDDFVDLSDLSICDNNASNFVSVIAP